MMDEQIQLVSEPIPTMLEIDEMIFENEETLKRFMDEKLALLERPLFAS
jgi:hypothetical protein